MPDKLNNLDTQAKLWDDRYKQEGALWGQEPSLTVRLLIEALNNLADGAYKVRRVIDVGSGYYRDAIHLSATRGAQVTGYEISTEGVKLGKKFADENGVINIKYLAGKIKGDFTKAIVEQGKFDGLMSHRTIHLLDDSQVSGFVRNAAEAVKPGGVLVVSARNFDDFDKDQMRWLNKEQGIAEYTAENRKGHIIRFWNEALFRHHFEKDFDVTHFSSTKEIESLSNPSKNAHFTLMIAYKKVNALSNDEFHGRDASTKSVKDLAGAAVSAVASMMRGPMIPSV